MKVINYKSAIGFLLILLSLLPASLAAIEGLLLVLDLFNPFFSGEEVLKLLSLVIVSAAIAASMVRIGLKLYPQRPA